jgi:predicted nucleotidyltransferase
MSDLLKLSPNFKPAFDGPKIASQLLSKISKQLPIVKSYLFGSAAHSKNTLDSDLDIILVVPDDKDVKEYYNLVGSPFFSPIAVDWIVMTEKDFNEKKEIGGVARIAVLTGIQLFSEGSENE